MEKVPQGKYTKEFKEEAAKMVTEQGLNIPEIGRRLSIPKSTIANWARSAKRGTLVKVNSVPHPFGLICIRLTCAIGIKLVRRRDTLMYPRENIRDRKKSREQLGYILLPVEKKRYHHGKKYRQNIWHWSCERNPYF